MTDKEDDESASVISLAPYEVGDVESAHALMACVFEHYRKHHEVVLRKLQHAQSATAQSIQEAHERRVTNTGGRNADREDDVKICVAMWEVVIRTLRTHGLSEDELSAVEDILLEIPNRIRNYYHTLLEQDEDLQAAIEDLQSEKYKRAFVVVDKIQSRPDRFSGLEASAFESGHDIEAQIFRNLPRIKGPKGKKL